MACNLDYHWIHQGIFYLKQNKKKSYSGPTQVQRLHHSCELSSQGQSPTTILFPNKL